jgi:hypothetical protein
MKLLWTKSHKPLSVLICKGLQDPCSHFVIAFDGLREIFQSNLLGTGLEYEGTFLAHVEVIHQIDIPLPKDDKSDVRQSILSQYDGKSYDYKAFLYFMYRAVLNRFFKVPYPETNKWQAPDTFLCVGLAKALDTDGSPEWLRMAVRNIKDAEMLSPEDLFLIINEAYLAHSTQSGQ